MRSVLRKTKFWRHLCFAGSRTFLLGCNRKVPSTSEVDQFFSLLPSVAEGFLLKTWRGGPEAGKTKLPPAAKTLVERGFVRLDTDARLPKLFFTEPGLAALRTMMMDRRLADPKKFAHIWQELGIDL
jgi:hypothetical protein